VDAEPQGELLPLAELIDGPSLLGELAALAARHRVLITVTFAPYDDPEEGERGR